MPPVQSYFRSERNEGLLFVVVGLTSIAVAFYFLLFLENTFYLGIAWPLLFMAIIQVPVGAFIYFRSPHDLVRVMGYSKKKAKSLKTLEIPRMEKVMMKFKIYRFAEMSLLVIGLMVFLYASSGGFWKGIGFGLVVQSGFMLIADSFAEYRGKNYLRYLINFKA